MESATACGALREARTFTSHLFCGEGFSAKFACSPELLASMDCADLLSHIFLFCTFLSPAFWLLTVLTNFPRFVNVPRRASMTFCTHRHRRVEPPCSCFYCLAVPPWLQLYTFGAAVYLISCAVCTFCRPHPTDNASVVDELLPQLPDLMPMEQIKFLGSVGSFGLFCSAHLALVQSWHSCALSQPLAVFCNATVSCAKLALGLFAYAPITRAMETSFTDLNVSMADFRG